MLQLKNNKIQFLFIGLMIFLCSKTFAAAITDTRISNAADKTRVVFSLNKNFTFKQINLNNPPRVVIDLPKAAIKTNLAKLNLSKTVLKAIRTGKPSRATLRVVFDLRQPVKSTKAFRLKPSGKYGYRLVVDFSKGKSRHTKTAKKKIISQPKTNQPLVTLPTLRALRDIVVIIDPGHGGKDPGAVGRRGTREKRVVLSIAKELKNYINNQPGMKAVLTRRSDYFISLRRRLNIARKYNGDMFIAIHADAFKNPRSRGASVFALSQRGATSEAARWLARRENYSELGGVDLSDRSHLVRSVLIDLSQTATIGSSLKLGNDILKHLGKISLLHNTKVEQAPFVVLKSPDIPSLLIETGFISNSKEEAKLRSKRYREQMAGAITRGILDYFKANPIDGTTFAALRNTSIYKVARGDNLSSIANRYSVSVKALKKHNRLLGNHLHVGQVLRIPKRS